MSTIEESVQAIGKAFADARAAASQLSRTIGLTTDVVVRLGIARTSQVERLTALSLLQRDAQSALVGAASKSPRRSMLIEVGLGELRRRLRLADLRQVLNLGSAGPISFRAVDEPVLLSESDPRRSVRDIVGASQIGLRIPCEATVFERAVPLTLHLTLGFAVRGTGVSVYLAHEPKLWAAEYVAPSLLRSMQTTLADALRRYIAQSAPISGIAPTGGLQCELCATAVDQQFSLFGRIAAVQPSASVTLLSWRPEELHAASVAQPTVRSPTESHAISGRETRTTLLRQRADWWDVREIRLVFDTTAFSDAIIPILRVAARQAVESFAQRMCEGKVKRAVVKPDPRRLIVQGSGASDGQSSLLLSFQGTIECKRSKLGPGDLVPFEINFLPVQVPAVGTVPELQVRFLLIIPRKQYTLVGRAPIPLGSGMHAMTKMISSKEIVLVCSFT